MGRSFAPVQAGHSVGDSTRELVQAINKNREARTRKDFKEVYMVQCKEVLSCSLVDQGDYSTIPPVGYSFVTPPKPGPFHFPNRVIE